jgi:capsular exopolysaccharide synthesis family protein
LMASVAAGMAAALLANLMGRQSMDLQAVAERLGTRALGAIPRFRNDAREPGEVRIRDPRLYIESVRSLRNAIFEQPSARETRVCLFTSVAPSEGKTLVAMSVARSLARSGVRVLFLEMDLRCPTAGGLARRPDVARGVGAVLEGRLPFAEVIQRDADTGLDMLFAEKTGGVSLDRLTAQAVAGLLARLRARYDAIVIDSPPVGVICDSLTLAGVSDQTVLVVRDGETTPSEIAIAVRMLRERGATLGGMVLTDVDPRALSLSRRTVSRYVLNAPARIALVKSA